MSSVRGFVTTEKEGTNLGKTFSCISERFLKMNHLVNLKKCWSSSPGYIIPTTHVRGASYITDFNA